MELGKLDLKTLFFILVLIVLGYFMLQVFSPFVDILVISLILVQIFYPMYKWLSRKLYSSPLASLLSTLASIGVVVIPITIVIIFAAAEVNNVIGRLEDTSNNSIQSSLANLENSLTTQLTDLIEQLRRQGIDVTEALNLETNPETGEVILNLDQAIAAALSAAQSQLGNAVSGLLQGGLSALFSFVILLMTLLYLFHDYENLPKVISDLSPLDDGLDELLFQKLTDTTRAVIVGNFVVAITQATLMAIPMMLMGVEALVLLWMIMLLFSLIPVGSGVVWVPVGVIMVLNGNPLGGIFLIVFGAIVINVLEATLRPFLLKDSVQLHPLAIMFSALGGIAMFGPLGLLYGPLLTVFFTSLMSTYTSMYSEDKISHAQEDN